MCCLFASLILIGPRAGVLVWWMVDQARWQLAFQNFLVPLLGFAFLPWTTLMYVAVFPGGVAWFDWIWLGIGILADIATYSGNAYRNRDRFPAYAALP
jgi:hypothetical protein